MGSNKLPAAIILGLMFVGQIQSEHKEHLHIEGHPRRLRVLQVAANSVSNSVTLVSSYTLVDPGGHQY